MYDSLWIMLEELDNGYEGFYAVLGLGLAFDCLLLENAEILF